MWDSCIYLVAGRDTHLDKCPPFSLSQPPSSVCNLFGSWLFHVITRSDIIRVFSVAVLPILIRESTCSWNIIGEHCLLWILKRIRKKCPSIYLPTSGEEILKGHFGISTYRLNDFQIFRVYHRFALAGSVLGVAGTFDPHLNSPCAFMRRM